MFKIMLKYVILFVLLINVCVYCAHISSDEEYIDSVINMLLNGASVELERSDEENDRSEEPVLNGGIWKCGNCSDVTEAKLVYTESNEIDADMITDHTVDIQIGLILPEMRCVTVSADVSGVVRRVSGTCSGGTVTLSVSPAQHFTVQVYS